MATELDSSVFYRGFSADSPITTGAEHLSAAATRLAYSILYSLGELPDALWQEFKQLMSPDTLWGLVLVVAAWLLATIIGGPLGAAINAALAVYGLYELWPVVKRVSDDLWAWLYTAYLADTEDDLHRASRYFAEALAKGGMTTVEAIVTHRIFHGASQKIRARWPTPEWLRERYAEQESKRSTRKVEDDPRRRRTAAIEEAASSAASTVLVPAGQGAGEAIGGWVIGGIAAVAVVGTVIGAAALSGKGR